MLDTGLDWEKLSFELLVDIKRMMLAIPTTILGGGADKLAWVGSPHGSFDMKCAYRLAMGLAESDNFVAKWIWKADLLPKIKTFLWMCAHNSIGVKVCLERRGAVHDNVCPICCNGSETILHALRDCIHLKQVWSQLGVSSSNHEFWHSNLLDCLSTNATSNGKCLNVAPPWKIVFSFALWSIWKSRNNFVFNRRSRNPNLAVEIINQAVEYYHCVTGPRVQTRRVLKRIRWEKPLQGWRKLNTDGSALGEHGLASCGGVIRDEAGHWIAGFSKRIGHTSCFAVELWGLKKGLLLCHNLNIQFLEIELDAKSIVDVLGNLTYVNNILSPILDIAGGC